MDFQALTPREQLEWLRNLPPDGERFDAMREGGVTVTHLYAALDYAPVGTTIMLHGGYPALPYLATRTSAGWDCPTLPPVYGIYARGPYDHFWRGCGFDLSTLTVPA